MQGQTQHIFHNIPAEYALIFQIVDRVNVFHPLKVGILHEIFFQVGAQQAGMPVVGMNHVRFEIDVMQHGQRRFGKIGKPFRIIVVAVQFISFKIVFIVNEIHGDAVLHQLFHTQILVAPGQVHRSFKHGFHYVFIFFADTFIVGDHQSRFYPQGLQCFGQGSHHVGQSAGLDKRSCLRCNK